MKQQSSSTAEGIALVRAIESSRPADRRICNDPIARSLISGFAYTMSKLVIDSGFYARLSQGAIEFLVARERYIDDFLSTCLQEGLEQVVLLGAGFDTRAYRIPGIERTRVFEVDHPATQQDKLKRLKKVVNPMPPHVTFVPLDFNTQTLAERLPASGYNEQGKTLFIWQGVIMYLTAEGVDDTLGFISRHTGRGSALIFDYFTNESLRAMRTERRITRGMGEGLIFGIDEGCIEPFLAQRGFSDVRNVTSADLQRLYFTGPNAERPISKGAAIASARV